MNAVAYSILLAAILIFVTAVFCLLRTRNIIRIIIAIEVMMKAVTLLLVFAGYVSGSYALAQAFVITMIVIEVVVTVVAAGIAISVYRKYGSLDLRNLTKLKG